MKKYNIYSDIFFIKGYLRVLVFDSLRKTFRYIPHELYNYLLKMNFSNFNLSKLDKSTKDFLQNSDMLFEVDDDFNNFPRIDLKWNCSFKITNLVFVINYKSKK